MADKGIFDLVITPAVVAGVVTWWLTQRNDGVKARRDYHTKASDNARDDVKAATEAGVEYFAKKVKDRSEVDEAKIISLDLDVRRTISRVLQLENSPELSGVKDSIGARHLEFMSLLTGGSFQQRNPRKIVPSSDAEHIRRLATEGANLRASLAQLRDEQLIRAIAGSNFNRHVKRAYEYMHEQLGINHNTVI